MKKLMLFVLICAWPAAAYSHPGKTDKYGGHMCLKGCEEWKLFYKEYHLHDKYGKPIRVAKKKAPPKTKPVETPVESPEPEIIKQPAVQSVTTTHYVTIIKEEKVLPFNLLLLALLFLLMLLLIVRRNSRKADESKR